MKARKTSIILFIISILLYGNTLLNGWGLDDLFVLKDNAQVMGGLDSIPKIFASPYYQGPGATFGYRPLTKALFAVEYEVVGINLPVHHAINVILYFLCGLLVFRFLRRYFESSTGMLFVWTATVFWMLHPIHTEVVASLKNREELLWMIFGFLSLEQAERFVETRKLLPILFSLLLFVLSYLAKQSALSLALAFPLLLWYRFGSLPFRWKEKKTVYSLIVILLIMAAAFVFYRLTYRLFAADEMEISYAESPLRYNEALMNRISLGFTALLFYLKILVFPHPLQFYYGLFTIPEWALFSIPVLLSVLLHLVLIWIAIYGLLKKSALAFGAGFYLVTLFMFSNFPENVNGIVAERLVFVPSIGYSVFITALLFRFSGITATTPFAKMHQGLKVVLIVVFLLFSAKTIVRNTSWKDTLTLFKNDIRYAAGSAHANAILAEEMMSRVVKELQKGTPPARLKNSTDSIIFLYKRSWVLYPENYRPLNNMGDLYLTFRNDPDSALLFLAGADRLDPDNFFIAFNAARAYEMKSDTTKALVLYQKAVRIKPEKKQAEEAIRRLMTE